MDIDGTPALARVLDAAAAARSRLVIVVVGHQADEVRALVAERGIFTTSHMATAVTVVENPDPSRGQTSSVQTGLAAVPNDASGVLVWPVDHSLVQSDDIAALVAGAEVHPEATVVLPTYRGRAGHPALLRRALFARVMALPADAPLHTVVRAERARTHFVERPVDTALRDLDTPAEVDKAREEVAARREAPNSKP